MGDRRRTSRGISSTSTACRARRRRTSSKCEGIGPERAEAIAEWFSDDANRALVEELRELGLRFEIGDELKPVEGPLTGSTYVITGTLEAFTRDEAAAALEAKGAKVGELGLGEDDGLIVGEEPGNSKLTKARKARKSRCSSEADLVGAPAR